MKVGDLVKSKLPTTKNYNKVFLVTEWRINWIKVLGRPDWYRMTDFEVISESRCFGKSS